MLAGDDMGKEFQEKMNIDGLEITVVSHGDDDDYISLTDIARKRNPEFPADVIKNWLRNRSTIEFLGLWEIMNNTEFKLVDFDQFKQEAGSNGFVLSPQKWINSTNAIRMRSKFSELVYYRSFASFSGKTDDPADSKSLLVSRANLYQYLGNWLNKNLKITMIWAGSL